MYIVTGGAGFIGSATVSGMNKMGIDDILIVDHLGTSDKWKNLRALKFNDYMEKDVFRHQILNKSCGKTIDAIIHLGACSSTTQTDASFLIDNNFNYSRELAEYAVSREIRFVYASSAATYGDGSSGYCDDEKLLDQLRPLNIYGYSKHLFDSWAKNNGLLNMITGLKFTNIFGPNETHKDGMRSVVSKAFDQIRSSGKLELFKSHKPEYADGEQKRDFLYIKDAVDIVLYFLDCYDGGLFNVGSGRAESWNYLAACIFKALDTEPNIEYIDMPIELRDRYQYHTQAEMNKLSESGYSLEATPLEEAIDDYIKNYLIPNKYLGD